AESRMGAGAHRLLFALDVDGPDPRAPRPRRGGEGTVARAPRSGGLRRSAGASGGAVRGGAVRIHRRAVCRRARARASDAHDGTPLGLSAEALREAVVVACEAAAALGDD